MFISDAYAQSLGGSGGSGGLLSLAPLVLMFVALYVIMIRPQLKRQKETKAMLEALGKGDEVVTQGGVLGRIVKLGETYVSLEIAQGVQVQVQRVAVIQVLPKGTIQ